MVLQRKVLRIETGATGPLPGAVVVDARALNFHDTSNSPTA